jgi:hypothetical protein
MRLRSLLWVGLLISCGSTERSGFSGDDTTEKVDPTDPSRTGAGPSSSFGGDVNGNVVVEPKNTTIIIDTATSPVTKAEVSYKVLAGGKDVTDSSTFELSVPNLGSFAGPHFTSAENLPGETRGVTAMVKATTAEGAGLGQLTIVKLRKTGPQRDFYFVVPYQAAPSPPNDTLVFGTSIKQVDVAFAMDTTLSMGLSISNLRSALSGTLLADLQAAIPNVGLAVVDYRDYPVSPYGSSANILWFTPDWPVKVRQTVTTNLAAVQAAVNAYNAGGGADGPEGQIPAMQHILTGEALTWTGGSVPAVTPSPGHFGAVDFRPGAVPVVVNITDTDWHGEGHTPYDFATPTMATLKDAFKKNNAFFVDISSGDQSQADELSDATNSNVPVAAFKNACGGQCCTGANGQGRAPDGPGGSCRLVFRQLNGSVSTNIVNAIQAISVGASYDVKANAVNDPANAHGVDATKFIKTLRAMDEGNAAAGCPAGAARDTDGDGIKDTFLSVVVGTKVCFEVVPAQNSSVTPDQTAQFYNAFVDVIGVQGNVQLDRRSVLFLVPPKDAEIK